ncbi:uncharacterized protein LOC108601398 [Drosophila busckii]|uniref:uncharacterized protein LOC108601398 n=1 Tax=Drosophila busckii TaxID=30019 RepID=UPI00083F1527|nr:uncharacterized protein LOC108601398 [Drosophila busckii]
MNFNKLTFFIAALVALFYLTEANKKVNEVRDEIAATPRLCPRSCNEHFKCNPFHVAIVYSIVNGRCRLFNNPCIFRNINCNRRNQCLRPYEQTTEEECRAACHSPCLMPGTGVCATFYSTNSAGDRVEEKRSFPNRCSLDAYTCQKGVAYPNYEVTEGLCP